MAEETGNAVNETIRFRRLGGAGVAGVLWECAVCLAATADRDGHHAWHVHQRNARELTFSRLRSIAGARR